MFQVTLLCLFLFRRTVQFNFAPVKHSSFFMATLLPLQPDCFLSGKIETSCIRLQISPFTKNSPSCPIYYENVSKPFKYIAIDITICWRDEHLVVLCAYKNHFARPWSVDLQEVLGHPQVPKGSKGSKEQRASNVSKNVGFTWIYQIYHNHIQKLWDNCDILWP